jgi:hypothetical protein
MHQETRGLSKKVIDEMIGVLDADSSICQAQPKSEITHLWAEIRINDPWSGRACTEIIGHTERRVLPAFGVVDKLSYDRSLDFWQIKSFYFLGSCFVEKWNTVRKVRSSTAEQAAETVLNYAGLFKIADTRSASISSLYMSCLWETRRSMFSGLKWLPLYVKNVTHIDCEQIGIIAIRALDRISA